MEAICITMFINVDWWHLAHLTMTIHNFYVMIDQIRFNHFCFNVWTFISDIDPRCLFVNTKYEWKLYNVGDIDQRKWKDCSVVKFWSTVDFQVLWAGTQLTINQLGLPSWLVLYMEDDFITRSLHLDTTVLWFWFLKVNPNVLGIRDDIFVVNSTCNCSLSSFLDLCPPKEPVES